jgi:iron-sulfur cluster repair protein YtfE (RIC family)
VITGDTSICDVLQASPLALELLKLAGVQQVHIDRCDRLEEAAKDAGVSLSAILLALNREIHPTTFDGGAYLGLDPQLMMDLLRSQHHDFIDKRLPHLELLARRLQNDVLNQQAMLADILPVLLQLKASLSQHILEEQGELFTYVEQLLAYLHKNQGKKALIDVMAQPSPVHHLIRSDEDDLLFDQLRHLTVNYQPPTGASLMLRHFFAELERFEHDLQKHENAEFEILLGQVITLENSVLARL